MKNTHYTSDYTDQVLDINESPAIGDTYINDLTQIGEEDDYDWNNFYPDAAF